MNQNGLLRALCRVKQRRESTLPQMVQFFGQDTDKAREFLKRFSGLTVVVPKPKELDDLLRDASIAMALSKDSSPRARAELCRKHRVTHRHLAEAFHAALDRRLPDPHSGTMAARRQVAKDLAPDFPKDLKIVANVADLPLVVVRELAKEGAA